MDESRIGFFMDSLASATEASSSICADSLGICRAFCRIYFLWTMNKTATATTNNKPPKEDPTITPTLAPAVPDDDVSEVAVGCVVGLITAVVVGVVGDVGVAGDVGVVGCGTGYCVGYSVGIVGTREGLGVALTDDTPEILRTISRLAAAFL